jgi:ribosomal protein L7/L12
MDTGIDFLIIEKYKTFGLIPAIKLCREKLPLGIKEAKDYVESLVHDDKNKEI